MANRFPLIVNSTDSKVYELASGDNLDLTGSNIANSTAVITLPTVTSTLATLAGTETLTNKTINLTSNTLVATSAQLASAVTDETGTGPLVFSQSPTVANPTVTGTLTAGGSTGSSGQVLTSSGSGISWTSPSAYSPAIGINAQTGTTYTLALTDASKMVEMNNASANTVTIPTNASVAFKTGTKIDIIQYGAGVTSITGSAGVTLRTANNWIKINAQYGAATCVKVGTNEWYLFGNLSA